MIKTPPPSTFVTGGSGFIGSHLVRRLVSKGIGLRVLIRPNSVHLDRLEGVDAEIVRGDLADFNVLCEATKDIDVVYHIGGALSYNSSEDIYRSNIKGTDNLIQAALMNQVNRFVLISDIEVYDLISVESGTTITEDSPLYEDQKKPSVYTYSKITNERQAYEAYHRSGLGVTIVRPGMVVGPMGQVFYPHLGYKYRDKLFLMVGKGNNTLPLVCVENLVDGLFRASIEQRAIGQIYHLVDDGEITVRDYLEQFIARTKCHGRIIPIPYMLPYLVIGAHEIAFRIGLLANAKTSRSQFKWKHMDVHFDSTKAKNDLGWISKMPLYNGLDRMFEWYLHSIQRQQ